MHPLFAKAGRPSGEVINAAIERPEGHPKGPADPQGILAKSHQTEATKSERRA
jgi:hypothetical protein